jgi:hypothetical protein
MSQEILFLFLAGVDHHVTKKNLFLAGVDRMSQNILFFGRSLPHFSCHKFFLHMSQECFFLAGVDRYFAYYVTKMPFLAGNIIELSAILHRSQKFIFCHFA